MALGGGTFLAQNKVLPGAYINFVSTANADATLSDRGIATLPIEMDWGPEGTVIPVEIGDLQKNSQKLFGYAYSADQLKPVREIFKHAQKVYFYRLNAGGTKASCTYATAKYPGTRGNDLRIVIDENENSQAEAKLYDVSTYLGTVLVDQQTAISGASALKSNDYVDFTTEATLAATAGTPLTNGTNGTVEDAVYQTYLDKMEAYTYNAMGCPSTETTIKCLFAAYCKRMRDEVGKKFQVVCFRQLADYEGVVSLKNGVAGAADDPALVPWVTGLVAGTAVNKSASNAAYDGEYTVDADYTQAALESAIREGSFVLHAIGEGIRVLEDINTFVSVTDEKSTDFASNQTIRVLDQIANDIAVLFGTKYIGKVPNDASGRVSLWNDIVKHHQNLQNIRAIEGFTADSVTVAQGDNKKAVVVTDKVTPVSSMSQLYMTVYIQ